MSTILETIDTRLGTYNSHAFSNGNTLPLTGYPFGMTYFAPQTTDQHGNWWFNPYEPVYQGIRLTHQPSPWVGDFSQLLITPVTGTLYGHSLFHRQSSYDMDSAVFRPDLLKLYSHRFQVTSQLSPSLYGATLDVNSASAAPLSLVFHAPGWACYQLLSPNQLLITLKNASQTPSEDFAMYAVLKFDDAILSCQEVIEDGARTVDHLIDGNDLHFQVTFKTSHLQCQLATSFISPKQAKKNLLEQEPFAIALQKAGQKWTSLLSRILIEDLDKEDEKALFYHCLYRCLLFPQTFFEKDDKNQAIHFDPHSNSVKAGKFYTNNGYWDTFRSNYPLLSILYPDYLADFLEGILQHYQDTGFLPKWLSPNERAIMPGTLVDGVIADAVTKVLASDITPQLFEAMLTNRQKSDPNHRFGRTGNEDYQALGYLPRKYTESVSHSLDYAYSDWCIGTVAKKLGHEDLAKEFFDKSLNYKRLFDAHSGFLRAKDSDGNFREPFNPYAWGKDYAECSAIQSTLGAYHDIEGTISLLGGKVAFTQYLLKLCQNKPLFTADNYGYEIHEMSEMAEGHFGQLALSNQPSFHIPYLFHWSQKPEYTSLLIKQLRSKLFTNTFTAFPGDEDNGSMSAWYLFSCLGFYPVCPGKATYQFGIPLFSKVTLDLPENQALTIVTQNNYDHFQFVDTVTLDSHPITELKHQELIRAKSLVFRLSLLA